MAIILKEHNTRPYQQLCYMLKNHNKTAYISATGTGKTYVVGKYIEAHNLQDSTLILVPLGAIREEWRKMFPDIQIDTYQGVVAKLAKDKCPYHDIQLIVCDELHHLGAEVWGSAFRTMFKAFDCKYIGLSATPVRYLDNARDMVQEVFDGNRVDGYTLPEAINKGILPTFRYVSVMYNFPQKISELKARVKSKDKGLTPELKNQIALQESTVSLDDIMHRNILKKYRKVIVFCGSIKSLDEIQNLFSGYFPEAEHCNMHSAKGKTVNAEELRRFKESKKQVFLYVVDMLSEGFHVDDVDAVVMLRKTKSPIVYLQQLGRGLTAGNIGKRILVCDLVANHINIENYTTVNEQVIGYIKRGITEEKRQIIVEDYAIKQYEILEKLNTLLVNPWTPEEVNILKEHASDEKPLDVIGTLLPDKDRAAILAKMKRLGLYTPAYTVYTEEEDMIIRENYHTFSDASVVRKIILEKVGKDRPEKSIKYRARQLGIGEKKTYWSNSEVSKVKSYIEEKGFSSEAVKVLAKKLGKTEQSVRLKALREGCIPTNKYTADEDAIIIAHYEEGVSACVKLLKGRSADSVKKRGRKLGLIFRNDEWTDSEDKLLLAKYQEFGAKGCKKELAKIGKIRSLSSIRMRAHSFGFPKVNTKWSKREEEELKRLYYTTTNEELAKMFGRKDARYISKKAKQLGLQPKKTAK